MVKDHPFIQKVEQSKNNVPSIILYIYEQMTDFKKIIGTSKERIQRSPGSIYTGIIKNTYRSTFGSYIKELLVQKYCQLISTKQLSSVDRSRRSLFLYIDFYLYFHYFDPPFIIYKSNYANYEIQRVC
jgi:hypothetical protein